MTKKEIILTADLLNEASDEFSNHGCNDIDDEYWKDWTFEERLQLSKELHEWNGDSDEYNEKNYDIKYLIQFGDSELMSYFAYKLKKENGIS